MTILVEINNYSSTYIIIKEVVSADWAIDASFWIVGIDVPKSLSSVTKIINKSNCKRQIV